MPPELQILQRDGRPMLKVNSTIVTLGIAGVLAIAVGFYVNSVNWKPVDEETKTAAGTQETGSTAESEKSASYPT